MDVYMMLYGGQERSESDLRALLTEAGFAVTRLIATAGSSLIVECEPTA